MFFALGSRGPWSCKVYFFAAGVYIGLVASDLQVTNQMSLLLNVLTGIFVETAMSAANNDKDNIIQAHLEERESFMKTIATIFMNSNRNCQWQLTEDEMNAILQDPQVVTYFHAIGLDTTEAMGFFQLLDEDGSGSVSIDEFVTGFLRLKGTAKAVDMVTLMYENRKISKLVKATLCEAWTVRETVAALQQDLEQQAVRGEISYCL